jgi:hypothetical protein
MGAGGSVLELTDTKWKCTDVTIVRSIGSGHVRKSRGTWIIRVLPAIKSRVLLVGAFYSDSLGPASFLFLGLLRTLSGEWPVEWEIGGGSCWGGERLKGGSPLSGVDTGAFRDPWQRNGPVWTSPHKGFYCRGFYNLANILSINAI